MAKVTIISINYNQLKITLEMLESLYDQDYFDIEIIIVDNGSKRNPTATIRRLFPDVITIRSKSNRGFAGGNNLAIAKASGKYLFFINNDTLVPSNTIANLVQTFEDHPDAGMISPLIYYHEHPQLIQYAGYTPINAVTGRNHAIGNGQHMDLSPKIVETAYGHGAAMMISKSVISSVGMMFENYFMYYEELDWATRIKESGYKVLVAHNCHISHKESRTIGKDSLCKTYFQTRNRILFIRKNVKGFKKALFFLFFGLFALPKNLFSYLKNKDFEHLHSFIAGICWNIVNSSQSEHLGYKYNNLRNS